MAFVGSNPTRLKNVIRNKGYKNVKRWKNHSDMPIQFRFVLKAYTKHILQVFSNNLSNLFLKNKKKLTIVNSFSIADLPTYVKKLSILRSPHVNKNSREAYEFRTYTKIIDIEITSLVFFTKLLHTKCPSHIFMAINLLKKRDNFQLCQK